MVADGWSIGIIVADLMAAYNEAVANPEASPIDALQPCNLPLQYTAYSAWMHSALQSGVLTSKVRYWEDQLKGGCLPKLPRDPDAAHDGPCGTRLVAVQLSAEVTHMLEELAISMGTSTFAVIMAAYQVSSFCTILAVAISAPNIHHPRIQMLGAAPGRAGDVTPATMTAVAIMNTSISILRLILITAANLGCLGCFWRRGVSCSAISQSKLHAFAATASCIAAM